jgi:hypothetical protein
MTKTIIIFGIVVIVITIPLVVFYVQFPDSLGLFKDLVGNIIAGIVGGVLITTALDLIIRNRQQKSIDKVARIGVSEITAQVNRLAALFANMVKAASDGFIPEDFTSLFGIESAKLISLHLGLDSKVHVSPVMTWKEYIAGESDTIWRELRDISNRYQMYLSDNLLSALAEIHNNQLLKIMRRLPNMTQPLKEEGIEYPVLNIQIDTIKLLLSDIARDVETIRCQALRLKALTQVTFPDEAFRDDVGPKLGDSRYVGKPGPPMLIRSTLPLPEQMEQVDNAIWIQKVSEH